MADAGTVQAKLDLGIALCLFNWPALSLAVQNEWGGSDSADKREWFAGAISDLFNSRLDTDLEDVETMLLQVMLDEFEVNVDDESAFEVAGKIMEVRKSVREGDFRLVDSMNEDWIRRKGNVNTNFKQVEKGEEDDDTEWDDDSSEDEDGGVGIGESSNTAPRSTKVEPEVDEDGFTKVASKRRR